MTALIGLMLGMLLGIVVRELWPYRRAVLLAAVLLLIWTPLVWFVADVLWPAQ